MSDDPSARRGVADDRAQVGPGGPEGNSVGAYMCTDLACSLYLRGLKVPETGARFEESLTLEEQIDRTRQNLFAFIDKL